MYVLHIKNMSDIKQLKSYKFYQIKEQVLESVETKVFNQTVTKKKTKVF